MRIAVAGDHRGYHLKNTIAAFLQEAGHEVLDLGAFNTESSDYPDFAHALGAALQGNEAERGILICGSGVGASIAANKMRGIRAGLCHDAYSAGQGVQHDDMNVLCLGSMVIGEAQAKSLVTAFVEARFHGETERYTRRLNKVIAMEDAMCDNDNEE